MEPARACRADVHTRSEADRVEALEDCDVLSGISGFSHEKSPAISLLAGTPNSTRTSGRYLPLQGSKRPLLRPLCGGLRRESLARVSRLLRGALGPVSGCSCGPPRKAPRVVPESVPGRTRAGGARALQGGHGSPRHDSSARTPRSSLLCARATSRRVQALPATRCVQSQ